MGDERDEVLGVDCPKCGAKQDVPCIAEEGESAPVIHLARRLELRLAIAQIAETRRGHAKLYEWTTPPGYPNCECIAGKECTVWLERQPFSSDRGRFRATLDCWGKLGATFDHQDGWPRYYTDLARGKAEVEEWIRLRERSDAEGLEEFDPATTSNPMVVCDRIACDCQIPSPMPDVAVWTVFLVEPMGRVAHLAGKFCNACMVKFAAAGVKLSPSGKLRQPPKAVDCFVCGEPGGLWAMGDRYLPVCYAHAARFQEAVAVLTVELIAEKEATPVVFHAEKKGERPS